MEDNSKKINRFIRANTKIDLINQCKNKGLPINGNKYDLAMRLFGITNVISEVKSVDKIQILIDKDDNGNYIHHESKLVFDKPSKKVIGYNDDGKIKPLSKEHIDICKKYKFQIKELPFNLDEFNTVYEILENSDIESDNDLEDDDEEDDENSDME